MKVIGNLEVSKAVSRMNNDVDIRVYGAKGDGITDDTIAIQNAILSLGSTGGTVFFPKGIYKVTEQTSLILKESISFRGIGAGSVIRVSGITGFAFLSSQCSNLSFRDMAFVGDGINVPHQQGALSFLKGDNTVNSNHIIDNVIVSNFSGNAIQIQAPRSCKINNVNLENIGGIAINIFNGDSINIESVSILNCNKSGVALDSINYATIADSKIDNCGIGFQVLNSSSVTFQSCGVFNSSEKDEEFIGNGYQSDGSNVTLISCFVKNSANEHLVSLNNGLFNYINFINGDTNKSSTIVVDDLSISSNLKIGLNNIILVQGSSSNKLKITSSTGIPLSLTNPGYVVVPNPTTGLFKIFIVTEDIVFNLNECNWGINHNTIGAILRIYAINDNNILKWGVSYQGGFISITNSQSFENNNEVTSPEYILLNENLNSNNSFVVEVGYIRANFNAENISWNITHYFSGQSADGQWQPWIINFNGFAVNPTISVARWTQNGKKITAILDTEIAGVSNSHEFSSTIPIKPRYNSKNYFVKIIDNDIPLTAPGLIEMVAGSNEIIIHKTVSLDEDFLTSGGKSANFMIEYEAYAPSGL